MNTGPAVSVEWKEDRLFNQGQDGVGRLLSEQRCSSEGWVEGDVM